MTESAARDLWRSLSSPLAALIRDLAEVHRRYAVLARLDGGVYALTGSEPRTVDQALPSLPDRDGTWLMRDDGAFCDLRPLLTYEPVHESWEIEQVRSKAAEDQPAVPQSYFKFEGDQLYYTPIGVNDFVSISTNTRAFARFLPAPRPASKGSIMALQQRVARQKHINGFVGRNAEINVIEHWLEQTGSEGNRIGLIVGGPGIGKSALLAKCAFRAMEQIDETRTDNRKVLLHAFDADNPSNDRRQFLLSLRQQLSQWTGRALEKKA